MDDIKVGDVFIARKDRYAAYDKVVVKSTSGLSSFNQFVLTNKGDYSISGLTKYYEKFEGYYPLYELFQGVE